MLREELRRERRIDDHAELVSRCERNLDSTVAEFCSDMTGQDGEREIDAAARDLISARDEKLRFEDPERWAEKQMGA